MDDFWKFFSQSCLRNNTAHYCLFVVLVGASLNLKLNWCAPVTVWEIFEVEFSLPGNKLTFLVIQGRTQGKLLSGLVEAERQARVSSKLKLQGPTVGVLNDLECFVSFYLQV